MSNAFMDTNPKRLGYRSRQTATQKHNHAMTQMKRKAISASSFESGTNENRQKRKTSKDQTRE